LGVISDITSTMKYRFVQELDVINKYFNEVFRRLFGGGKAGVVLEDPNDVTNFWNRNNCPTTR